MNRQINEGKTGKRKKHEYNTIINKCVQGRKSRKHVFSELSTYNSVLRVRPIVDVCRRRDAGLQS